eukprot:TRINITY_DN63080_c0_g1_i1.p1 TRINITY_DN63080_c0_g1~~TRINITY_DN63080_c0_g1_i1.p1  ORF type:complete len:290 (+),score=54.63 TRINITY_DN63080_c0_g1_i1:120-989(+)
MAAVRRAMSPPGMGKMDGQVAALAAAVASAAADQMRKVAGTSSSGALTSAANRGTMSPRGGPRSSFAAGIRGGGLGSNRGGSLLAGVVPQQQQPSLAEAAAARRQRSPPGIRGGGGRVSNVGGSPPAQQQLSLIAAAATRRQRSLPGRNGNRGIVHEEALRGESYGGVDPFEEDSLADYPQVAEAPTPPRNDGDSAWLSSSDPVALADEAMATLDCLAEAMEAHCVSFSAEAAQLRKHFGAVRRTAAAASDPSRGADARADRLAALAAPRNLVGARSAVLRTASQRRGI